MKRRKTRQIKVGDVRIGGNAPVSIQSMTKVETSDVKVVVSQIKSLENCGCEIVRVAVKTQADARAIKDIKKKIRIPLVADIHFDYRLALAAIASGADKIRINPGNMRNRDEIKQVVKAAKKANIPIRIGVNSGSVFTNDERILSVKALSGRRAGFPAVAGSRIQGLIIGRENLPYGTVRTKEQSSKDEHLSFCLVTSVLRCIKLFEDLNFRDIIISLKASDVSATVKAYRKIAKLCDYPLHLGVTASGPYDTGIVKSSIGIGALLLDGIGDTIRVSLTAEPEEEVIAAKRILSSLGLRNFGPEIISCPTCGRCQVDLVKIVGQLDNKLKAYSLQLKAESPLTVAVMGCEVNGPGEAREADIGIAFGKGSGMLFRKGKTVRKVVAKNAVSEILKAMR